MVKPVDKFLPLYTADYLADTMDLCEGEHGVYLLLIIAYWRNGGPLEITPDRFCQIGRCARERYEWYAPRIRKFFEIDSAHGANDSAIWRHKRIDAELERANRIANRRSHANRENVLKRWKKKENEQNVSKVECAQTKNEIACETDTKCDTSRIPIAYDSHVPSPSHLPNGRKRARDARLTQPENFDKFWQTYPHPKRDPKQPALAAWLKLAPEDQDKAVSASAQYASEHRAAKDPPFTPHARTWLNQRRFDDYETSTLFEAAPDWADNHPGWREFKSVIGPGPWASWFAGCRLDGAILVAPSAFSRDEIARRYGQAIARLVSEVRGPVGGG